MVTQTDFHSDFSLWNALGFWAKKMNLDLHFLEKENLVFLFNKFNLSRLFGRFYFKLENTLELMCAEK
jgi:hypothetical protein